MEVAVNLLLLEELSEGTLNEGCCGTEQCEDPHPEDCTGTTHDDGGGHSCDVTYTDTGTHTDAECLEGRDHMACFAFALICLDTCGFQKLDLFRQRRHLHTLELYQEQDACSDDEDEGQIPKVCIGIITDPFIHWTECIRDIFVQIRKPTHVITDYRRVSYDIRRPRPRLTVLHVI